MDKNPLCTATRIKNAARRIFERKGLANATTRDIATDAESNIALVNYYFRSKENLFMEIFEECISEMFMPIVRLLNENRPLDEKIVRFVDQMTDLLKRSPHLPLFIVSELRGENLTACNRAGFINHLDLSGFHRQIEAEAAAGHIRQVDALQLEQSLFALTVTPFVHQNMFKLIYKKDDADFFAYVEARKQVAVDMIRAYLRPL